LTDKLPWFQRGGIYADVTDEAKTLYYRLKAGPESLPYAVYTSDLMAPFSGTSWIRMDSNALDLETTKEDLFFQYFFSVLKDGLVYMQYPLGEQMWTSDRLIPTSTKPATGCVTFRSSPYNDPSEMTEFFMHKGVSVGFKFRNIAAITMNNELRFLGRKFRRELVPGTPDVVAKARAIRFARIP
jgi:hypothetical protein